MKSRVLLLVHSFAMVVGGGPVILRYEVPASSAASSGNLIVREVKLYDADGALTLPATTCGSPPCARASSQWSDWAPERAFDGDTSTAFSADGGYGWLQYEFASVTIPTRVVITFWSSTKSASGTAYLKASNDGTTYTMLLEITDTKYTTLDVTIPPPSPPSTLPIALPPAAPGWHYVLPGEGTLQAAFDAAPPGDTLVLADGVYKGSANAHTLWIRSGQITIRALNAGKAILDGSNMLKGQISIQDGIVILEGLLVGRLVF